MKKIITILVFICIGATAFAHPPKDVVMSYDTKTQMLSVTIIHLIKESKAPDPMIHFVKFLSVTVNDKEKLITNYRYQETDDGETVLIKLALKKGDKVSAMAWCNFAGEKRTELEIK
jgi:hypothetical protein